MIQYIGLLFIILILIVVFIICIVQRPIYCSEKIDQKPIYYGGANDIVDNTKIIINTIVASPIHVNITASGIPIIDAFREFNTNDLLQTSFIDAFKAYKTYVYDASMIEDFINEIEPLPPPPPPLKTEEEKLLRFREEFGYTVNIAKFVELRDRILSGGTEFKNDGITRKIQKLSYLKDSYTNKHTRVTTPINKIKLNYLNDAEYTAHKAQYTLESLINTYNSKYNQKINKINNFKDKYYEFSKNYDIFEIFYDIYINIKKGYITNMDNLKNYFILKFNIVINLDLIDKIKEKKKEVLKHCCEKLRINTNNVFITVAAITKDNNPQFDNIKALEAIDGNQCWKLLQTLKKYFNIINTSSNASRKPDYVNSTNFNNTIINKFTPNIDAIMIINNIDTIINDGTNNQLDMLNLIIVFLYINKEYNEILAIIYNIKNELINIDIKIANNIFVSDKLSIFNNLNLTNINKILTYINILYNKHPSGRYISGIFTLDVFNINVLACTYPPNNIPYWTLYEQLKYLYQSVIIAHLPTKPDINTYIDNNLINDANGIIRGMNPGQQELNKIISYQQIAEQNKILSHNKKIESDTENNIKKLENLLSIVEQCIQVITYNQAFAITENTIIQNMNKSYFTFNNIDTDADYITTNGINAHLIDAISYKNDINNRILAQKAVQAAAPVTPVTVPPVIPVPPVTPATVPPVTPVILVPPVISVTPVTPTPVIKTPQEISNELDNEYDNIKNAVDNSFLSTIGVKQNILDFNNSIKQLYTEVCTTIPPPMCNQIKQKINSLYLTYSNKIKIYPINIGTKKSKTTLYKIIDKISKIKDLLIELIEIEELNHINTIIASLPNEITTLTRTITLQTTLGAAAADIAANTQIKNNKQAELIQYNTRKLEIKGKYNPRDINTIQDDINLKFTKLDSGTPSILTHVSIIGGEYIITGGGPIADVIHDIGAIAYTDIDTELRYRVPSTPDEKLTSLKRAFNNINKNMNNDFKLLESFFSEFITILRESNPSLIPNNEKPVWVKEEKILNDFVPPIKDLIVPKKLKESIASIYSMITYESNKVSKTIEILQHIPIIKEKHKVYYNPLTPEEKKMIKKKLLKEDRAELDEEYDIDEIINGMKTNNLVYGRYTLYKDNMWKTIIIPII